MADFETITCSRCMGSGKYSYCQMYGDTCFKCHGKGIVYSKRALAAREWLRSQRTVDIGELKIGDRVFVDGVGKFTVRTIEPGGTGTSTTIVDGEKITKTYNYLTIKGKELGYSGVPGMTSVLLIPPPDIAKAQWAQAIEMQNQMAA